MGSVERKPLSFMALIHVCNLRSLDFVVHMQPLGAATAGTTVQGTKFLQAWRVRVQTAGVVQELGLVCEG